MKLIKTKPRYRCDFCKYVATAKSVERHEKICWRNPKRHCELCNNKGWYDDGTADDVVGGIIQKIPCYYCSQYDATKLPPLPEQTLLPAPHPIKQSKDERK